MSRRDWHDNPHGIHQRTIDKANEKKPMPTHPTEVPEAMLLACPFCGEKAVVRETESNFYSHLRVGCETFGCRGAWKDGPSYMAGSGDAIKAWNRRSPAPAAPPEKLLNDIRKSAWAMLNRCDTDAQRAKAEAEYWIIVDRLGQIALGAPAAGTAPPPGRGICVCGHSLNGHGSLDSADDEAGACRVCDCERFDLVTNPPSIPAAPNGWHKPSLADVETGGEKP